MAFDQNEVTTALRYAGSAAVWSGGALVFLGVLSPEQSTALIADVHQMTDGLQQAFGGFSKAIVLIAPIVGVYLAKVGVTSSSLTNLIKKVIGNDKVQLDGKLIVPSEVANAVPSEKVVAK